MAAPMYLRSSLSFSRSLLSRVCAISVRNAAHDAKFAEAKEALSTLNNDPGNQTKLLLYGLFKQATVGTCNTKKPGVMDFVGKAKWDAWNGLGDLSQDDAQLRYIKVVEDLISAERGVSETETARSYNHLEVTSENNVYTIRINRPEKKNALTVEMYEGLIDALSAAGDSAATVTVLTGTGDYYCSGNDLNNFMNVKPEDMAQMAQDAAVLLKRFVASFIDHPKPLIAVVNGPSVGVSCTVLALCDAVYATDKANEMLLFNRKLSAREACERSLVTEVFPQDVFQAEVWQRITAYARLPVKSLVYAKRTSRDADRAALHAVNAAECERLAERWISDDCMAALMQFFSKK